ncbi:MAG: hypothetical protein HC828_01490 [Blastochloris sp.]|nr:hypothetical protein [Blastochloris sp.]
MNVEVYRSLRARAQYAALAPAYKTSVRNLEALLRINPFEGFEVERQYTPNSRRIVIRVVYGMQVRMEYRTKDVPDELQVIVEDIRPSDLPSLTEYEEGEEQRRSRPFWRGWRRRSE